MHGLAPLQPGQGATVNVANSIGILFGMLLVTVGLFFFAAWLVMLLWNAALQPATTGLRKLGYWQSCGVLLLLSLLFGAFHMKPFMSCFNC